MRKNEQNGQLCDILYRTNPVYDVIQDVDFEKHLKRLSRRMDLGLDIHESELKHGMLPATESDLHWLPGDNKLKFMQDIPVEDESFD